MEIKQSTTTNIQLQLNAKDIIDLLISNGTLPQLPNANSSVTFEVPSGGDYSGRTIDIDSYNAINVKYSGDALIDD